MATITPTNMEHLAGVPSQWSDTINPVPTGLFAGETPAAVTEDMTFALSQTIAAYTPVGFNASGDLIPAVQGSGEGSVQAVGITLMPITVGGTTKLGGPVLRQGCLNADMIAWPASYDSAEKKIEAFRGAPTPTSIVVRKVYLGATVAQP